MAAPVTRVVVAPPVQQWNENDTRYKCCCQNCHVKTGAMIIGIVEAVLFSLMFLSQLAAGASAGRGLLQILIWVGVLSCLFWGLRTEKAVLLLPHLVIQVIGMVLVVILMIILVVALASGESISSWVATYSGGDGSGMVVRKEDYAIVGMIYLVSFALGLGLEIWFFLVILGCYRFFKDKEQYKVVQQMNAGVPAGMAPTYAAYAPYPGQEQPPPYDYAEKK